MNTSVRPGDLDGGTPLDMLAGSVERVTFHSAETGFCVLKVHARGRRDLVPVVGHAPAIAAGEWLTAYGRWVTDREHGLQFRADTLQVTPPTGIEGIERYLASGQMRGIGPMMAKRIVARFGEAVFEIIEAEPARLTEVEGIGRKRAARIVKGWAEQKAVREIMIFLHAHGVGTARATRIFRTYGGDSLKVMAEDPYRLARDIRGIGFRTADAIALRLGLARDAPQRLAAGVSYALQTAMDEGHCGLPVERLVRLAADLLDVASDLVRLAAALVLREGREVVADTLRGEPCLFLKGLHGAERVIAMRLAERAAGPPPWAAIDFALAKPWVEAKTGKTLSASQAEAVGLVLRSKLCVLTGGPGVGKTSTLDAILRILTAKGVRVLLAAPTGRAAKRMAEQTGLEARTLHRLLEIDPRNGGFQRNEDNPLDCDLLVIDETSMVDVPLMHALLKAVPERAGLILVGDVDQLPLGRTRTGARRRDCLRNRAGGAPHRDLPSGGAEPDRRQRSQHQHRADAGRARQGRGQRLLPRRDRGRGRGRGDADRTRHPPHPPPLRPRSHPRHPSVDADDPRLARQPQPQQRPSARVESVALGGGRALRLALCARRPGDGDPQRLRPRRVQRRPRHDQRHRCGGRSARGRFRRSRGDLPPSTNSTRWCRPSPRRSTRRRARNIRPW
ncbi:protein of unknown function [Methylorubrum extorquens]|uniref:ATP-dependent RecD-like DNA helicase n=1 Tax=Methylorubrum extorquens TaxID=408 RepID=A0A2N9AHQ1_METEX|nr:protein of unknown function [Methylorubrum extorquens]